MSNVLRALNQRPIAYYPIYKQITGSMSGAVLLSQIMYWFSKKDKFYKTNKDFRDELGLSEAEMKAAKKRVREMPFITVKRQGVPAKTYYTIDWEKYEKFITSSTDEFNNPGGNKGGKANKNKGSSVGLNSPNKGGEINPTITDTTTNTTIIPKGINQQTGCCGTGNDVDSTKRNIVKNIKIKQPTIDSSIGVHVATIELIDYWNSFDTLTTHRLARQRTVAPLGKQSKRVQNIDSVIKKVMRGTYYKNHADIPAGAKKKKFSIEQIKEAIARVAKAASPDYNRNQKFKPSLDVFFYNQNSSLGKGKLKLRYKYAFLHFFENDAVKVSDAPQRKNSEYPIIVERTLKHLKGTRKPNDKQYNQVVRQVDKAVEFLKKVSNGRFAERRRQLPDLLKETLIEENLALTVDNLPLGVYNLEKLMRKRLMI